MGPNAALDEARAAVALDATGLIVGGGLRAELTHLDPGFFASPGGTTELVREHAGRAGLPPVFLHHRQASWLELETGAELHVRLLLADVDLPLSTKFERVVTGYPAVKGYKAAADLHPAMVASWPRGASDAGRRSRSSWPAWSTCSWPCPRRCGAGCTSSRPTSHSAWPRPPAPWWHWPGSRS